MREGRVQEGAAEESARAGDGREGDQSHGEADDKVDDDLNANWTMAIDLRFLAPEGRRGRCSARDGFGHPRRNVLFLSSMAHDTHMGQRASHASSNRKLPPSNHPLLSRSLFDLLLLFRIYPLFVPRYFFKRKLPPRHAAWLRESSARLLFLLCILAVANCFFGGGRRG